MENRRSWKEPVRKSLVKRKEADLVAHAALIGRQCLLGSFDRFSRKQNPPNHPCSSFGPSRMLNSCSSFDCATRPGELPTDNTLPLLDGQMPRTSITGACGQTNEGARIGALTNTVGELSVLWSSPVEFRDWRDQGEMGSTGMMEPEVISTMSPRSAPVIST